MSKIREIFEGWGNLIKDKFHLLDEETKRMAERRLLYCNTCHMRNQNTCSLYKTGIHSKTGEIVNGCGCGIGAKTLSPDSECPLGKW